MSVFPHQLFKFTVDGLVAFRTHAIDKNSRRFIFRLIMNLVQKSIPELLFLIAGANVASSTSEHSIQQRCEKFPVLISEIQFFQIIVAIPSIVHLIYNLHNIGQIQAIRQRKLSRIHQKSCQCVFGCNFRNIIGVIADVRHQKKVLSFIERS